MKNVSSPEIHQFIMKNSNDRKNNLVQYGDLLFYFEYLYKIVLALQLKIEYQ